MLSLPPSRPAIAILNPAPSAPNRFSADTRHSSNTTARVGCAFQPILRSLAPSFTPGVPPSTRKVEIPLAPVLAGARHHDIEVVRVAGPRYELLLAVST